MRPRFLALLVALLALAAPSLTAQTVRGVLTVDGTSTPSAGAIVTLLHPDGGTAATARSDGAGRFRLTAPGSGTYQLRVERVGFRTVTAAPFALAAGETREHPLALASSAVTLQGLKVEGRRRCGRRWRGGESLQRVWEEARKALRLTDQTAASRELAFRYAQFERELTGDGRSVVRDTTWTATALGRLPFQSLPADTLAAYGYLAVDGSSLEVLYHAPDAAVLLSDVFLAQHCFRLRRRDATQPGMVGLEFEPAPDRTMPDIRGVLWLDAASAELRHLEFSYTGLRGASPDWMGGRMDFARLPTGSWIVRSWALRWPIAPMSFDARRRLLTIGRPVRGVQETGGTVLAVEAVHPVDATEPAGEAP